MNENGNPKNPRKGAPDPEGTPKPDNSGKQDGNGGAGGEQAGAQSSALLQLAATINSYSRAGARYRGEGNGYYGGVERRIGDNLEEFGSDGFVVPGFLRYDYIPTVGVCESRTDTINLAADFDYRFARSKNSGARNYRPVDMELIDLCVDSLVMWYNTLVRATQAANTYEAKNTYVGKDLVRVLGFDYDDLIENRPLLINHISILRSKLKELVWIPTHMYHTARSNYNSRVYKDGSLEKCQIYVVRQRYFHCYERADEGKGVILVSPGNSEGFDNVTFAQIQEFTKRLLDPLLGSEDFALIQGDIEKAWGDTAFVQIPEATFDGVEVNIDDDGGLRLSLMNSTPYSSQHIDIHSFEVKQTGANQVMICKPYIGFNNPLGDNIDPSACYPPSLETDGDAVVPVQRGQNTLFNFLEDEISAADVVRATAFHVVVGRPDDRWNPSSNVVELPVTAMGTEVLIDPVIFTRRYDSQGRATVAEYEVPASRVYRTGEFFGSTVVPGALSLEGAIMGAFLIANFDWHHCMNVMVQDETTKSTTAWPQIWDLQNPVFVGEDIQKKLFEARLLTIFNIAT